MSTREATAGLAEHLVVDQVLAGDDAADDHHEVFGRDVLEDERRRAGLDGVEQRVLVLFGRQDDDRRRGELPLDPLGRLDAAGRGQREVHEDHVGVGRERRVHRRPGVVRLGDDLEVGLALEDLADADAEQRVVVDDDDPHPLVGLVAPIVVAPTALGTLVLGHPLSFCVIGNSQPDDRARLWPRTYLKLCADELGPLAHELEPEVATASRRDRSGIEAATVVADLQHPFSTVEHRGDHHVRRARVLADILQGLLHHAKDHRLRGLGRGRRPVPRARCVMCRPDSAACVGDRVDDRAVQAELDEHRRPQLADEAAHVAELTAQQLAQELQLGPGHVAVGVEDAVDELHLEDRVRERLRGSVVDLLREPDALGLLRLDDPHLELGREPRERPRR